MPRLALVLFSPSALAHPGHGALEIHWHAGDLVWLAVAVVCVGFLIMKALKR